MLGKVLRQRTDWSNNPILVAAGAVLLGVAGGAAVAFGPYWAAFAALVALAFGYALLVNTSLGLATVIGIATILPFGTLPFKALITPNFLELALIALLGVWLLRLLLRHDESLYLTPLGLPIAGFIGLTLFSFIIGSNGSPDTMTLHNYFKFVLAVLFFFSVVNCVRTREQARQVFRMLIIGGAISAVIGLVLYFMNDAAALRLLTSLGRIGYPTSGRVLRYIEDNTSGVERAIGLAVDPNSFGGMLALVGALAATQVVSERPILPRKLLALLSGVILLALFLTYSRAALGGMVVAAMYVATLRYRRLWWLILAAGVVAVLLFVGLGVGEQFVQRVTEGIQFRDEANQMRLAEFQNAINIIKAYPFFGIGFGQAPELDLVAGVSNIYLAIAQRTGLIGLAAFLSIMGLFYARTWQMLRAATARRDEELSAWIVSLQAGMAAALAVGLLDHYFFNIEFSHMVALFWGCIGLAMALDKV
jgi:O-antigen ligase